MSLLLCLLFKTKDSTLHLGKCPISRKGTKDNMNWEKKNVKNIFLPRRSITRRFRFSLPSLHQLSLISVISLCMLSLTVILGVLISNYNPNWSPSEYIFFVHTRMDRSSMSPQNKQLRKCFITCVNYIALLSDVFGKQSFAGPLKLFSLRIECSNQLNSDNPFS